jgi:hypothetical protein
MRVGGLDCFNQKPSSIVTSVFFITNRPLGAQFILDVARRRFFRGSVWLTGNPNLTPILPTQIIRRGPKSDRSY